MNTCNVSLSQLLRESASKVSSEDQEFGSESLIRTAKDVGTSHTCKPTEIFSSKSLPILVRNENGELVEANVSEDINMLITDMGAQPKYSGDLNDDVDVLLNMHRNAATTINSNEKRCTSTK